ncbi:MAG: hypothetical protein IPK84_03635 [Candidatus Moraniibacteriota bacterium]|nr:MAG: hypothetical protein IPK84_03635 [Candidatus Moranbacteria bacterium]
MSHLHYSQTDNREHGEDKPSPLPIPIGTTLGNIIGAFKSLTANEYIQHVKTKEFPRFEKSIWQRNYYEHIIRNDREWNLIVKYIEKNPEMWKGDELYG